MSGQFTLLNYMDRKPLNNPRVTVRDGDSDQDMVYITIEDKSVKVDGREMIKAIQNLMRITYPYI